MALTAAAATRSIYHKSGHRTVTKTTKTKTLTISKWETVGGMQIENRDIIQHRNKLFYDRFLSVYDLID